MIELAGAPRAALSRRAFLGRVAALTAGAALVSTTAPQRAAALMPAVVGDEAADFGPGCAVDWVERVYDLVMAEGYDPVVFPDGFTPPSAARVYGYLGIAMYEAIVAGMPGHRSLAGQLTAMPTMPSPHGQVDWPTALSAAAAGTVSPLFATEASRASLAAFDAEQRQARREAGVGEDVLAASAVHGSAVATALSAWIAADGYRGIREKAARQPYRPPSGLGKWEPTHPNFGPAVEPHWGAMRPLVMRKATEVTPRNPVPFSKKANSAFHAQARHTYEVESARVPGQVDIARFWIDNPIMSGLPSGHWMRVVGQVAPGLGLGLDEVVETYARLGIALAEAFLSCWAEKYRTDLLRPSTYVRRYIDPDWTTLVNTPQFPEYTSGHSVASIAAAEVLTDLHGEFPYSDTTKANVPGGAPKTRHFTSFEQAAEEAAQSRIFGGIHFPMGVEVGKDHGRLVGAIVLARLRTRR